jgi:hypothetical protein
MWWWDRPAYSIHNGNVCVLSGLFYHSYGNADNPYVTNLPPACRPRGTLIFNTFTSNGHNRIDIRTNGDVYLYAPFGNTWWITLNGIVFSVASATATFTTTYPIAPYGWGYLDPSYLATPNLCVLGGLMNLGALNDRTIIELGSHPCRTRDNHIFDQRTENGAVRIDVGDNKMALQSYWPFSGMYWIALDGLVMVKR